MHLGEQLHAPHGFEGLSAGLAYHFLFSHHVQNRVLLVTFGAPVTALPAAQDPPVPWKATLAFLGRDRFEEAIRSELIRPCPHQRELPHWLGDVTVAELMAHDQKDDQRRIPHAQRIDTRLARLWPALIRVEEILSDSRPNAILSRLARTCTPVQNEGRYRTEFFAYIAFRRERLALHYPISKIGKWDRSAKGKKLGRPSLLGAWHGHSSCTESMQAMCLEGFHRYATPGQSMRSVYRKTITKVFGCVPATGSTQRKSFVHPEGKPYPTFGQFVYRVEQKHDLATRQLLKYGSSRVRSKLAPSKGSFSDGATDAMQSTQYDGYFLSEVAMGFEEGSHLPRLCVVRCICLATGMIVGIGFSVGGEKAEAYRMAKFCMAVDKVWYCNLYGLTITQEQWPSVGLPLHEVTDRGPGATQGADASDEAFHPIIKELAPAYSGQSKANVETRHPKLVKFEGAPQIRTTRLSIVQLVQREIWRVIESNNSTNVSSRCGPDAIRDRVLPTPVGMWNQLTRLGRSNAYQPRRDQAIRSYLSKVDLTVSEGSVYFQGFRFWSEALRDSGLLSRRVMRIQGYLLPTCVRHIFLDTPDRILTVDAAYGDGNQPLSVSELGQLAKLRAQDEAAFRIHREASRAEVAESFEAETGLSYDPSALRPGRPQRRNAASMEEARQIMPYLRSKGGRR